MGILRVARIYRDSAVVVVAVESVEIRTARTGNRCRIIGQVEPIAVVVSSADDQYALDMEANRTDLDRLRRDVAGLDAIL